MVMLIQENQQYVNKSQNGPLNVHKVDRQQYPIFILLI